MTVNEPVGAWLIGARGSIGSTLIASHWWIKHGGGPSRGMPTDAVEFAELGLLALDQLWVGGCDVRSTPFAQVLDQQRAEGILPLSFPAIPVQQVAAIEEDLADLSAPTPVFDAASALARLRFEIRSFRERRGLARVVVVNCSATLALAEEFEVLPTFATWPELESFIECSTSIPWGVVHAAAALLEGCAYVNFTPNPGTELPALADLALRQGLPHAGKDGKTGETLLKSVLAPMFRGRALRVLAWQGYNMLGNADGSSLRDPGARALKSRSKDQQLRSILPADDVLHTGVAIDYVPSLGDWKTAWDFIHFEGFLGVRMAMQFTWQGCDTILAVPLVLDLIRLVDYSWRRGEVGELGYLCPYFKTPLGCREHDFHRQLDLMYSHLGIAGRG